VIIEIQRQIRRHDALRLSPPGADGEATG